jgi:hypothetical protein
MIESRRAVASSLGGPVLLYKVPPGNSSVLMTATSKRAIGNHDRRPDLVVQRRERGFDDFRYALRQRSGVGALQFGFASKVHLDLAWEPPLETADHGVEHCVDAGFVGALFEVDVEGLVFDGEATAVDHPHLLDLALVAIHGIARFHFGHRTADDGLQPRTKFPQCEALTLG